MEYIYNNVNSITCIRKLGEENFRCTLDRLTEDIKGDTTKMRKSMDAKEITVIPNIVRGNVHISATPNRSSIWVGLIENAYCRYHDFYKALHCSLGKIAEAGAKAPSQRVIW